MARYDIHHETESYLVQEFAKNYTGHRFAIVSRATGSAGLRFATIAEATEWAEQAEADGLPAKQAARAAEYAAKVAAEQTEQTATPAKAVEQATAPVATTAREALATPRQIGYIKSLLAEGDEPGFVSRPKVADLSTLTRSQASALIDSLTGRY